MPIGTVDFIADVTFSASEATGGRTALLVVLQERGFKKACTFLPNSTVYSTKYLKVQTWFL